MPKRAAGQALMRRDRSLVCLVDLQTRLLPAIADSKAVVDRCRSLAGLAGDLDIPVVATLHYPEGLGGLPEWFAETIGPDQQWRKMAFGALDESFIRTELARFKRDQILLAGVETHVCVWQTAAGLIQAGYQVFVVEDATASRSTSAKSLALGRLEGIGASVVNWEMVFFEWLENAAHPEFRQLLRRYLTETEKD